jgi:hypothetical protein
MATNPNPNPNQPGPGAKAALAVVVAVAGPLLIYLIKQGESTAFFIFLILLIWTIAKFTGWWNPWVAAGAGALGWFAYGFFH